MAAFAAGGEDAQAHLLRLLNRREHRRMRCTASCHVLRAALSSAEDESVPESAAPKFGKTIALHAHYSFQFCESDCVRARSNAVSFNILGRWLTSPASYGAHTNICEHWPKVGQIEAFFCSDISDPMLVIGLTSWGSPP